MKKFFKIFFIVLGVLFFIGLLALAVFFIFDPFNLKSLSNSNIQTTSNTSQTEADNVDKNPLINEDQESTLESLGVDPASLPTQITPAMEVCFVEKLGQERVVEIMQGGTPTPSEFLKVKVCL